MMDKSERIAQLIGSFPSQIKAAEWLGVAPRSVRRYLQGTRTPSPEMMKRVNSRVYRTVEKGGIYKTEKVVFSDGQKFIRRTRVKGNLKDYKDEKIAADEHIKKVKKSGKEEGKAVKLYRKRYHYVK